jgi:glycosyltransferase involved in cell wall biosynthesis
MSNHKDKINNLKLAYITGAYPKLTTTFIDREITLLRQWGVNLQVISIRRSASQLSPEQEELRQSVSYVLPISWLSFIAGHLRFALLDPVVYWSTLFYLLTRPHPSIKSHLDTFLHFGEGVYVAHLLRPYSCTQIHAHFIHRVATVALIASRLLRIPYSVTAHAGDIYVNPVLLPEKLSEAKFIVTCTNYNKEHLSYLGEGLFSHKLSCIYHGLEVSRYSPGPFSLQNKGLILAVGQLREKKGFSFLLKACRTLIDQGYDLECHIVGEGPLRQTLEAQIRQLSLENTVMLCGALPHQEVINKYRQAAIFVQPSILSLDGDRDGIPNVILEAMAMELPVVSTRHSGIPEVVQDGINGLLVPPADDIALAQALARLLDSPAERRRLGQRGRQTVIENFDLEQNVKQLLEKFTAHQQIQIT